MYSYREKAHPFYVIDFIFSFKFIYILINVLEFTSDWREGKQESWEKYQPRRECKIWGRSAT